MKTRAAYRAGSFYEASPATCRAEVDRLIAGVDLPDDLPGRLYGGLVPHAGWMYSGRLAVTTLKALLAGAPAASVVLLGADHSGAASQGEVYDRGAWETPLGDVGVDEDIAAMLVEADSTLQSNPQAHAYEHSIEVQAPLIRGLAPEARIVPITVPPGASAVRIGQVIGEVLARAGRRDVVVVGSTDLTHHGGHFAAPGGRGEQGERWSRLNDRRMLNLIESMSADQIVPEALQRQNACGAGAVAAAVSACKHLGATRGLCLEYTNSYEITHQLHPDCADETTVGYASVVFA